MVCWYCSKGTKFVGFGRKTVCLECIQKEASSSTINKSRHACIGCGKKISGNGYFYSFIAQRAYLVRENYALCGNCFNTAEEIANNVKKEDREALTLEKN